MVIPLAYRARIFSLNPVSRRWRFGMSWGSKVPSRSRGVVSLISPRSPWTVLCECPLRRFFARVLDGASAAEVSSTCLGESAADPEEPLASEMDIQLGIEHAFQG